MREVIATNVRDIFKLVAAGCVVLGVTFFTAAARNPAEWSYWVEHGFRMWGFAVGAGAFAIFIDGRLRARRA